MIYLLIIAFFLNLIYIYDVKGHKKSKKVWFSIECVILILLFGFRYRLGGDSLSYEDNWFDMPYISQYKDFLYLSIGGYQPLYYLFVALVKEVSDSFVAFQLCHAIVVNTIVFRTIWKYCDHIFTAAIFYFIFYSFNYNTEILRESLAISVFLFSLDSLFSKKYFKYYLYCFVAFGFHVSALFLFILPLFLKYLSKSWDLNRVSLVVIFASLAGSYLLKNIDFLSSFSLLGSYNQGKLEYYSINNDDRTIMGYISMFIDFFIYFLLGRVLRKSVNCNSLNNLAVNIKLLLSMMTPLFPIISWRFSGYIGILFYITIADLLYSISSAKVKMLFLALLGYLFFNFAYGQIVTDPDNFRNARTYVRYLPYTSVISKEKVMLREGVLENKY